MQRQTAIAGYGALAFGAVLASYSALRPVRDALVLDDKPDQLPWLFTATFVAVSAASPLWSKLVARRPHAITRLGIHAFAAMAIGFAVLASSGIAPVIVGRVFYVWSAAFNLFVVSITWSLIADLAGPADAKQVYGYIAAGGTVGTLVGPLLTRVFADVIGVEGILVVSATLLELAALAIVQLARLPAATGERPDAPIAGGALDGLVHVAKSPFLLHIVGYVLCTATAATFVYLEQADVVHAANLTKIDRTELFASIDTWVAVVTLVMQLALARPLLQTLGPGIGLAVLPILQLAGIATLALAPSIPAVMLVAIATRASTHGLVRPSRELLFTVLSRDDKYRAKNAIDTAAYRFGDFASSWLYLGLDSAGATVLAAATIPLVTIWLLLARYLGTGFRRRQHDGQT